VAASNENTLKHCRHFIPAATCSRFPSHWPKLSMSSFGPGLPSFHTGCDLADSGARSSGPARPTREGTVSWMKMSFIRSGTRTKRNPGHREAPYSTCESTPGRPGIPVTVSAREGSITRARVSFPEPHAHRLLHTNCYAMPCYPSKATSGMAKSQCQFFATVALDRPRPPM
jgi:hypothetical protein